MTPLDGQVPVGGSPELADAYPVPRFIGIERLQQSARLAGLSGAVLLILAAAVAWQGTLATQLDSHWLVWAVVPAVIAAFGGPLLSTRPLDRRSVARWRLALLALMTVNSTAWAFAAAVAVASKPPSMTLLVIAWLALSLALLPSLSWLWGLVVQLTVQLLFTAAFVFFPAQGFEVFLLPLGLWVSQVLLALMAGLYSRRVDRITGDAHYLRIEAATLHHQMIDSQLQLQQAQEQHATLEAELAEVLDLAEDASRAKTEFLATMSHEIRTPLNGILPILEMLRETPLNGEQTKLVRTAQSSSRHLLRIINDILDFAKVESGKLQLETIEIDVRELVGSVTELMSGSARNRNLKLIANVADKVPRMVRGDPIRLRQVLINLVSNAVKFTEDGGIRVEVSCGRTSEREVELLFAVADTGIGMAPETADRLFQSFSQADASTTRKHGGTGLGLVICKRLVELMGGRIGVRSTLGQGSTFWFLVPLRKSVMEVPSARRDLKGVRILTLIPDASLAAKVARDLHDWRVLEEACSDPAEALAKLRSTVMLGESWGYQLALIDGGGIEPRLPALLDEIRSVDALQRLHIVIAIRSETLAQKLKRDYGVMVLSDGLRTEPLRRLLHRLFDVESRHFGSIEMRPEEVYDDLNVSVVDIVLEESSPLPIGHEFSGNVLLVEDNPVNLGVMQRALSRFGLSCQTATDGGQALAMFEKARFDIIFMDCQMPVMDGYEATRQIRRLEAAQGRMPTPIVAMTANAMAGDREKCIDAGMDDYLAKPVGLQQLRDCVAACLGSAEAPSPRLTQAAAGERPSSSILDARVLDELKAIMEDDYLSLLQTYQRNAPVLMAQVRSAIAQRDAAAMAIPLHSLKSSSANVGAMQLSDLVREAERHARAADFAAAEAAFRHVEAAFSAAGAALDDHMASLCTA